METAATLWRELAQDLKKEAQLLKAEIVELRQLVSELKSENYKLRSEIKELKKHNK